MTGRKSRPDLKVTVGISGTVIIPKEVERPHRCNYLGGLAMLRFLVLLDVVSSLRLLFYVPTLSYSHVAFNAELAERLVDEGHHVTMIQAVVDDIVFLNSSRFEVIRKYVGVAPGEASSLLWTNPGPFEPASPLDPRILLKLFRTSNLFVRICQALMDDSVFLEDIRQRKFDHGFLEQYDSCGFGFFVAAGIRKVSWLSATLLFLPQSSSVSVNQPLSYIPDLFLPNSHQLTFSNRIQNLLVSFVMSKLYEFTRWRQNKIFRVLYGMGRKFDLEECFKNMSTSLLINSSPLFDLAYLQSNEFVHVAGVTVSKAPQQLSPYWNSILSRSPFVLVSFGSIARFSDMPSSMKKAFLETFSLFLNTTFIVKWDDPPSHLPKNVVVASWLPQKAVIAHSNFLAMITHGGWSSILETVLAARPLVLIPLFADHWRNARVVAEKEIGIVLDKTNTTVESLSTALKNVLDDSRYASRAVVFSSMLRESSFSLSFLKKRCSHRPKDLSFNFLPPLVITILVWINC